MKLISFVLSIFVIFLDTVPVLGETTCRSFYGPIDRQVPSASWIQSANEILHAIKNRSVVTFPPSVDGHSLIPTSILADLNNLTWLKPGQGGRYRTLKYKIDSIESVSLEYLQESFVININYKKNREKRTSSRFTYSNEFYVWRNYFRKILNGSLEPQWLDVQNLPEPLPEKIDLFKRVKDNNFKTNRTLKEYDDDFGGELKKILKTLRGKDKLWIDMGAGSATAQITFLKSILKNADRSDLPRLRPVAYKIPKENLRTIQKTEEQYPEIFEYVEGKQTPTSIRRMESADLITDLAGIAIYADAMGVSINSIISAYIDILKPGGKLLISSVGGLDFDSIPRAQLRSIEEPQILQNSDGSNFLFITKR